MRIFITAFFLAIAICGDAQTTATNFTANDCAGNPHDLFTELDTGSVIVMAWVMPCGTCIGPSLTAYNIVQSYASSHPGRVKFYMVDDYANTTCVALSNWATTNNMPGTTTFVNASISMSDYGTPGMPKIVVLGGLTHNVYYNMNGAGSSVQLQNAINLALGETGTAQTGELCNAMSARVNRLNSTLTINLSVVQSGKALVTIYTMNGRQVAGTERHNVSAGENVIEISVADLTPGIYLVMVALGDRVLSTRIIVEQ